MLSSFTQQAPADEWLIGVKPCTGSCAWLTEGCDVQVIPALGAEQAVAFCGGIMALLTALGLDMRPAFLLKPSPRMSE